ncbi:putative lipid II flippase FtsW [Candidatus Babeliales bacterium]|nr:putative lipid II flippase FtsW [Candidatus Babeliales bacterium]
MVPVLDRALKSERRMFLGISLLLTLIGCVFVYSASSVFALEKFGSAQYFLKKHLLYLIPSFLGFIVCSVFPIAWLKKYASLFFFVALGLTIMTFFSGGIHIHGSSRWLNIFGKSFQPSEFLKLTLFIYLGVLFDRKSRYLQSFVHSYLPFLMVLGITFLVLLKQPDFGSVVTILVTAFVLFFVAEFNLLHVGITVACALPVLLFLTFSKAYRLNRILIFLNPWADPQGRGFQIIQSLIAIGSGHVWGLGIANSKQKFFYLPMQHTDFIFSIIAEEMGFVGCVGVIACYFLFFWYGLRLTLKMNDSFAFFTSLGFVVFITLQAVINIMVTTGLLPTKGLGLPFISYGGTSLLSLFCMLGLIINFSRSSD